MNHKESSYHYKEVQLTKGPSGHCLYITQCFSPDDQWIAYDTRNEDGGIMGNGEIAMVHTGNGNVVSLYKTRNQGSYGPGVGAASFSPVTDRVLFIHGIRNASEEKPYSFSRRTGVAVDTDKLFVPLFMDGRTIEPPFPPGVLRGGTHAHSWSGDGQWISFTYNDWVLEQLEKQGAPVKDLRTVGVMAPGNHAPLGRDENSTDPSPEQNSGELFSFLIAEVTENPAPGSDAIDKAFDECWIGKKGYRRPDGSFQTRAIAFQGNLRDAAGQLKTEIFVADIPDEIVSVASAMPVSYNRASRPVVPPGIVVRRISHTERGVSAIPRHWLRSTADGGLIGFLAVDEQGFIQLFGISPSAGPGDYPYPITRNSFSVAGSFNFSPDGKRVAYIGDNSVWITEIASGHSIRVAGRFDEGGKPEGAVIWSNDGTMLCYNRRIFEGGDGKTGYLQIFLLRS